MKWEATERVGAEEVYLLHQRDFFGRSGKLVGAFRSAADVLESIGTSWPQQRKQRLYAVHRNGNMREVTQSAELMRLVRDNPQDVLN